MKWQDIDGFLNEDDAEFVTAICCGIHGGLAVELGAYKGRGTAAMAPICRERKTRYVTVDDFKGGNHPSAFVRTLYRAKGAGKKVRGILEENLSALGLNGYVEVVESDSADAAALFDNGEVDFCFIDACHQKEAVQKDIESWWPKMRAGGTLGGHDYGDACNHVKRVVDEFVKSAGLSLRRGGRCWSVAKELAA